MNYLIFTGGTVQDTFAEAYYQEHSYDCVLAADHGIEAADRLGIPVQVLLGDFDSADPEVLAAWMDRPGLQIVRHNPIKDATDTELAITYAVEHGATHIDILGCTGTRMDHFLGTVQSLYVALQAGVDCVLADANNRIRLLAPGRHVIRRAEAFGTYLSLIPLGGAVEGVTLRGVKYQLTEACIQPGNSLGVSNEITGDAAEISFSDGILIEIQAKD